ncbi:MAG TPA: hypothetical protein VNN72_23215 [Polyangiaceae bacterium]|nr:hypothetical protein [Polyangiaceae bacterium]
MKPPVMVLALGALVAGAACSSETPSDSHETPPASGGTGGSGGAAAGSGGHAGTTGGTSMTMGGGAGTSVGNTGGTSGSTASGGAGAGTGGAMSLGGGAGLPPSGGTSGTASGMAGTSPSGGAGAGGGAAGMSGGAGAGGGKSAFVYHYGADVENTSLDCTVAAPADPASLPKIQKLPDPFIKMDGTKIGKRSDWHCRRQEILKQAEKYIYGERPAFDKVSGEVTNTKISVHVEALSKAIDFSVTVKLPTKGSPPYPAIINVGASGMTIGESRVLDQGVAVLYYNMYDLGKEGTAEASRGKPNPGKFYDIYGGTHSAGLLQAWSWGASRLIDVIQQSDGSIIDVSRLGVTGCSRNGKGAFAVGLWDERIALTIPYETSTGGVPAYRIVDVLNTERTDYNYFGLNWLSDNFEPFVYANNTSNAVKLPIDTHSLIGTMAPRGLMILENPHQTQMSAPAGHIASVAGLEIYKQLGVEKNLSYVSNVKDTPHCSYKDEYTAPLIASISTFLKHEGEPPGKIDPGSEGQLKIADWKDWTSPTLENDVTLSGLTP